MRCKGFYLIIALICMFLFASCGSTSTEMNDISYPETEVTTADAADKEMDEEDENTLQNKNMEEEDTSESGMIYVTVNNVTLSAKLEDNTSAHAFLEKLAEGDIIVDMSDYANFEKVGYLGFDLPRNDEQYTTKAGDIILYQSSNIVFYYDTNSWNFTKLGEFQDVTKNELAELFGDGDITARISLKK